VRVDRRAPDVEWQVRDQHGSITWEKVSIAVLMDIRRELKTLNRLLACPNFLEIPRTLRTIRTNTANLPKRTYPRRKPPAKNA
jgi:hypothetical protein